MHIQLDLILTWLFQDAPNHTFSETNLEDNKTNEATEDISKSASENVDEDTQTQIKRQKTVSFSENVEQEIEEATEGKSFLKSALQLFKASFAIIRRDRWWERQILYSFEECTTVIGRDIISKVQKKKITILLDS